MYTLRPCRRTFVLPSPHLLFSFPLSSSFFSCLFFFFFFAYCSDFANALRATGASLAGVAARDPERAQQFAKAHGVAKAYASYEELAADPAITVVYVGTIHTQHKEHTVRLLLLFS